MADISTYNYEFVATSNHEQLPTVNAFYLNSYGTGKFEPWDRISDAETYIKSYTRNPTQDEDPGYVPRYITVLAKDTDGIPYEYQYTSADGVNFEWKKKEGSGEGEPVTIDYIVVLENDRIVFL